MKSKFPKLSIGYICSLFSFSRQAYYAASADHSRSSIADMLVLTLVKQIREDIPGIGVRKLFHMITPEFERHQIKMGRDHLFDLLRSYGLLIRKRKRIIRTTPFTGSGNIPTGSLIWNSLVRNNFGYPISPTLKPMKDTAI